MIPEKIGRYEIKSELGRGGMATVYRAFDPSFDREVAIKVLPKEFLHDPLFRERFKREVKIIAALEHAAIVPVYDVGDEDGVPFFVMRYMPGGSLTNQIEKGKFSMEDAARIIERLSSALAYAHKRGIIHRDLKPDNILFDSNGDAYISDFGVAGFVSSNTNLTGESAIGTPAYMSPEQAQGDKVDSRSDIYGLGVIIFQMLSGQQPFKADTPLGVALKQITDPVPDILEVNPELPRETDTIIKTAMAKKREDRYPSATELAKAFGQAANPEHGGASSPTGSSTSGSSLLGNRRTLIIAGIAVIGLLAVLVVMFAGLFFFKGGILSSQPSSTETATVAPTTTIASPTGEIATATAPSFFTEDFGGGLDHWPQFATSGDISEMTVKASKGSLLFNLPNKPQELYAYYSPQTYGNVKIDLSAENKNQNVANVYIVCRYNESEGWYEFNIGSDGFFKILYRSWNQDKKGASFVILSDGATNRTLSGKNTNEYSVICKDRTLSLTINGRLVRSIEDNRFVLGDGNIAVGVGSLQKGPVEIQLNPITISQP